MLRRGEEEAGRAKRDKEEDGDAERMQLISVDLWVVDVHIFL